LSDQEVAQLEQVVLSAYGSSNRVAPA
jgi:hypothetical protein